MKLVLMGIQGSGKSTQGNLLSRELNLPYLSSGHIFRRLAREKTPLGRYVKETMAAGLLISDSKTISLIHGYLQRPEYKDGYILDGFPRTLAQAKEFVNGIDKVIFLQVSEKEALWRLSYRKNGNGVREDETLMAVRKRIEMFYKKTNKVLDYYRQKGILLEVNGEQSIEDIFKEIMKKLKIK